MGPILLALALLAAQATDDFAGDMARLVPALGLRAGQTVADVGAGRGELTVALAKEVGPAGRVYATEIATERRADINRAVEAAGLQNVTVLEAHASRANLPDACCDAVVVRYVYHHFDAPAAINRSILAALKPGGRLAVIDFAPRSGRATAAPAERDQDAHGVDADTVARELSAAGFERVSMEIKDRGFLAVFRKSP